MRLALIGTIIVICLGAYLVATRPVDEAAAGQVELRFAFPAGTRSLWAYTRIVRRFMELNPDIYVKLEPVVGDFRRAAQRDLVANMAADVIHERRRRFRRLRQRQPLPRPRPPDPPGQLRPRRLLPPGHRELPLERQAVRPALGLGLLADPLQQGPLRRGRRDRRSAELDLGAVRRRTGEAHPAPRPRRRDRSVLRLHPRQPGPHDVPHLAGRRDHPAAAVRLPGLRRRHGRRRHGRVRRGLLLASAAATSPAPPNPAWAASTRPKPSAACSSPST